MTTTGTVDGIRVLTVPTRRPLLMCGLLSSVLYVVTDVIGGLRYPGYSFTSQAISELMAIGAPSEPLVDPLFVIYDLLVLAFGAGILLQQREPNRALRATGVLLFMYGLAGAAGPVLFEMHQRGAGPPNGDLPHVVVTAILSLLLLAATGVGALALGNRFRVYSFVTLGIMIMFGALSVPYGARLADGLATPGFGIVERLLIYASMAWIATLSLALLARSGGADCAG